MKELSVVVLGDGRWARALTGLLTHNQNRQRGAIGSVIRYTPRAATEAPLAAAPRAAKRADSDDATMMNLTAEALASAIGQVQLKPSAPALKAGSEDATMMGMTAESLGLPGPLSVKTSRGIIKAGSEDATMMGMTAESLARAVGGVPDAAAVLDSAQPSDHNAIDDAEILILAVPPASVRTLLRQIHGSLRQNHMLIHCVDGLFPAQSDGEEAMLISDIVRQETPITRMAALAGPARPEDIEEWSPASLVCGTASEAVFSAARQILGGPTLRIYLTNDMIGVEVARAMNSVVALASGVCDVMEFGPAARVMLVSRSAAEIARLGIALGGKERTFLGLAGVGGLMLASEHRESADFQLGRMLGAGKSLFEAHTHSGHTCDSVSMVREAYGLAQSHGLRMPILTTLHRILFGSVSLSVAIHDLLEDPNSAE
jgi:glycerol-3-phosphate dehydrogenase (NAD(P)+)